MDFYELLGNFDQIGGFDLLLPFILVFTLMFAVLEKIKLFGEKKNINMVVSLVVAIFFLNNTYLIFVLQKFLPNVSILLVIFLMALLLFGIFAGESPLSMKMGVCIDTKNQPLAVCTSSGTIGHSLSMGKADAVCVISRSCSLADAAATSIGNQIKTKADINKSIDFGKKIDGIIGIVVIMDDKIGLWGDIEVIPLKT